jgi:hypothetical protein
MATRIIMNCETGEQTEEELVGADLAAYEAQQADWAQQAIVFTEARPIHQRLRTTNATPTELYRATLAPLTGYRAALTLIAVDAGNGAVRTIEASIVAKRLANGAVLVGAPVVIANHQDAAASTWAISAAADGNHFVIAVAGAAGRNIDWMLSGEVVAFTPGGRS